MIYIKILCYISLRREWGTFLANEKKKKKKKELTIEQLFPLALSFDFGFSEYLIQR